MSSLRRERTLARRRAEQRGGGNAGGAGWRDAGVAGEAAGPTGPVTLEEEMWTTDESDGEVAEWRRRRDEVRFVFSLWLQELAHHKTYHAVCSFVGNDMSGDSER